MDIALAPFRAATSKPAQRTYLSSILFFAASLVLFGLAIAAYGLFYFNFIPQIDIEQIVYLQFGNGQYPHGVASLGDGLVSQQAYDVIVDLDLPRSPPNLAAGNFMLNLSLLSSPGPVNFRSIFTEQELISYSRRPAILTYTSPLVDKFLTTANAGWFLFGWKREAEKLEVQMLENMEFAKGWRNVPKALKLEVQSDEKMMFYSARVRFAARFSGLRWIMYNHRILSFIAFTAMFWLTELLFTALAWFLFSTYFFPTSTTSDDDRSALKTEAEVVSSSDRLPIKLEQGEDPDAFILSDRSNTLATFSRQPSLGYPKSIKKAFKPPIKSRYEAVKEEQENEELITSEENLAVGGEFGGGESQEDEYGYEEVEEDEELTPEGDEEGVQYEYEEGEEDEDEEEEETQYVDEDEEVEEDDENGEAEEQNLADDEVAESTEIAPLTSSRGARSFAAENSSVADDQRTERSGTVDSGLGTSLASLEESSGSRPTGLKKRKSKMKGVK
ncbi:MAG: hypothetical protein M1837_005307 [Sclerophora amabilis]|nr:MAG: hypothetical protein M1837_005307 [Sclerophora amabilis]